MHAGKHYPFCKRPDIAPDLLDSFRFVLPRKIVIRIPSAFGSLVTPWIGFDKLSNVYEVSPDEKHVDYFIDGDIAHPGQWQVRFGLTPDPGPTGTQIQNQTYAVWFRIAGLEVARIELVFNPGGWTWIPPAPTRFNVLTGSRIWTHTVPNSQFREADFRAGSAPWSMQPEYMPYRTRP